MMSRDAMRRNVLLKRLAAAVILCVLLAGAAVAGVELALRFAGLGDPIVYYTNLTYRFAPMSDQRVVRPGGKVVTDQPSGPARDPAVVGAGRSQDSFHRRQRDLGHVGGQRRRHLR